MDERSCVDTELMMSSHGYSFMAKNPYCSKPMKNKFKDKTFSTNIDSVEKKEKDRTRFTSIYSNAGGCLTANTFQPPHQHRGVSRVKSIIVRQPPSPGHSSRQVVTLKNREVSSLQVSVSGRSGKSLKKQREVEESVASKIYLDFFTDL